MILNYLEGLEISENRLMEEEPFGEKGITFVKLMEVYQNYLTRYKAQVIHEKKQLYYCRPVWQRKKYGKS